MFGVSPAVPPSHEASTHRLYCYPHQLPQYEDFAIQNLTFPFGNGFTEINFKSFTHNFLITRENGSKYYGTSLTLNDPGNDFKLSKYFSKCIVLISDYPFYTSMLQYLEGIQKLLSSPNPDLTLDSYLYNIVNEVSFPSTGSIISYDSPCKRTLHAVLPSKEDMPLFQLHYLELCKILNPHLLIKVITCILLEYSVLVVSDDPCKLNYFSESLTSLIYPFTWDFPFVPILPSSCVEFLEAPLPCFIGWLSRSDQDAVSDINFSGTYCQIDLSTSEIKFSKQSIPSLPFSEQISNNLIELYNSQLHSDSQNSQARQAQISSLEELMSIVEVISNLKLETNPSPKRLQTRTPERKESGKVVVEEEYIAQLEFDCKLRELFYTMFLNTFSDVGKFIIKPDPDAISHTRTFDKVAYLSEKSRKDRDFLCQFFETHMFTKFIDDLIEITSSDSAIDRPLTTDAGVFQYNLTHAVCDPNEFTYPIGTFNSTCKRYIQRLKNSIILADAVCPSPREMCTLSPPTSGYIGTLPDCLAIPLTESIKLDTHPCVSRDKSSPASSDSSLPAHQSSTPSPAFIPTAVELTELLKEASHKIKQLITHHVSLTLRHHYEQDGAEFSPALTASMPSKSVLQSAVSVEDKGLISSLVEALERIWEHECSLSSDGSLLWQHILAYKQHCEANSEYQLTAVSAVRQMNQHMFRSHSLISAEIGVDILHANSSRRKSMGSVSNPLLLEVQHILEQENIMTDIGRVRMWVKLLLEKKVLKKRVQELLTLHSHLNSSYQLSAFLRAHGELEQLLYHLDSLSCVEFSCFTHDFPLSQLTYSLTLSLGRSVLRHTSVLWVLVSGSLGRTDVIKLDKGSHFCSFSCRNIGHVLGVRVGHDNGGLNPDVFIQHIEMTSNLTGMLYWLCANKNLSDSQKDECVEYYFPADRFSLQSSREHAERGNASCLELSAESIRIRLQNAIRELIHYFTEPRLAKQSLTYLVLGECGLIPLLLDLMLYNLFSSKQPYSQVWALFSQIFSEISRSAMENDAIDKFLTTSIKLAHYNKRCGPAEKIKVFLTVSLSQGILHEWIQVMSKSKLTPSFYNEESFFLNSELKEFLFGAVATLRSYQISVDPLFTLYMDSLY